MRRVRTAKSLPRRVSEGVSRGMSSGVPEGSAVLEVMPSSVLAAAVGRHPARPRHSGGACPTRRSQSHRSAPDLYPRPMRYSHRLRDRTYTFDGLVDLLAKATPDRSGDQLAGCAAGSDAERVAAQWALADVGLTDFLTEPVVPPETDDVTRLIWDTHDAEAFAPVRRHTVGQFREWLLDTATREDAAARLSAVAAGLTPEMVAAVSKLMRNQDLVSVASATSVTTAFRTTLGLPGRLSTRLQPNHPADDPVGVAGAVLDGLLLGAGDAVIGVNPASDNPRTVADLLRLLDDIRTRYDIPV